MGMPKNGPKAFSYWGETSWQLGNPEDEESPEPYAQKKKAKLQEKNNKSDDRKRTIGGWGAPVWRDFWKRSSRI